MDDLRIDEHVWNGGRRHQIGMRRLIATCVCGTKVLYDYSATGRIDMVEAFAAHRHLLRTATA